MRHLAIIALILTAGAVYSVTVNGDHFSAQSLAALGKMGDFITGIFVLTFLGGVAHYLAKFWEG